MVTEENENIELKSQSHSGEEFKDMDSENTNNLTTTDRTTVNNDDNISFYHMNEEISEWIRDHQDMEESPEILKRLDELKERRIDDDYIERIISYIKNDLSLNFLDKSSILNKHSDRFDRWLLNTCRRACVDHNNYINIFDKHISLICAEEEERSSLKAILYNVTRYDEITTGDEIMNVYERGIKFINVFMWSMRKYHQPLLDSIVEKYNEHLK